MCHLKIWRGRTRRKEVNGNNEIPGSNWESKTVAIFGINDLALNIGGKECEQGHSVILFPGESVFPEELNTATDFARAVINQTNKTSQEVCKLHQSFKPRYCISAVPISLASSVAQEHKSTLQMKSLMTKLRKYYCYLMSILLE